MRIIFAAEVLLGLDVARGKIMEAVQGADYDSTP